MGMHGPTCIFWVDLTPSSLQRQLRAPQGQGVRLAINTVDLAPGAFLLIFDGATPPLPRHCYCHHHRHCHQLPNQLS
jgi:hypothetical protein